MERPDGDDWGLPITLSDGRLFHDELLRDPSEAFAEAQALYIDDYQGLSDHEGWRPTFEWLRRNVHSLSVPADDVGSDPLLEIGPDAHLSALARFAVDKHWYYPWEDDEDDGMPPERVWVLYSLRA